MDPGHTPVIHAPRGTAAARRRLSAPPAYPASYPAAAPPYNGPPSYAPYPPYGGYGYGGYGGYGPPPAGTTWRRPRPARWSATP